jgi:hypothetical protein
MLNYTYKFSAYNDGHHVQDERWGTRAADAFEAEAAAVAHEAVFADWLKEKGIAWQCITHELLDKA